MHLLEDAAWGLPHAAATTNHEQQANLQPCTPSFHAAHIRQRMENKKRKTKSAKIVAGLQSLIFDEFRGILIDTPNPSIK